MGVTYQAAQNVPGLSAQQLLLMANTSTSPNRKNQFMLVTFTDNSKTTVHQIEQFPDFNTLQPATDWRNRTIPVLTLFAFDMLAQILAALGFPIICILVIHQILCCVWHHSLSYYILWCAARFCSSTSACHHHVELDSSLDFTDPSLLDQERSLHKTLAS